MKAHKHTVFFDNFVISLFWRWTAAKIEFRDASTLLPQKRARNPKWTGLSDLHLALRNHGRIEPWRLARRAACISRRKKQSCGERLSGVERSDKEKDPVVGSTGSSKQFKKRTIDQADCVVACLVTLSA